MSRVGDLGEKSTVNLGQSVHFGADSGSRKAVETNEAVQDEKMEEKEDVTEPTLVGSEIGEDVDEYETTDFISLPTYSQDSTFEEDPLELEYSYGYDCKRPNLCVVDPETLLWHTGNIIHIFNARQRRLTFRRSALGQDISCIVKSRATDEFAVAENGGERVSPMIIIYRWPDFKVCSVLRGGATTSYISVDFSSDGAKLVSQAEPNTSQTGATLTVWDIRQKTAITSFQNPDLTVSKAVFSSYDPDVFVTCGTGHIKFWRLQETFTGLKMESLPGKFGEVENNDVSAVCFLPEGRVVSNFCGGNLAIWKPDASLELSCSMKNFEPCHSDLVTFIQIYLRDNHVYTSSLDGKVRVWNYSYITSLYNDDQQESKHVDIEPSYERMITDKKGNFAAPVQLLPKDDRLFPYHFYVQDIKGGIWLLDLALKKNPDSWSRLYSCHAGPLCDMSPSPGDYYLATLGPEGDFRVYSHTDRMEIVTQKFEDACVSVLWFPFEADSTGSTLLIGFNSGMMMTVRVKLSNAEAENQTEQMSIIQICKPHSAAVTVLSINKSGTLLLSGSKDKTVFLHGYNKANRDKQVEIVPLGLITAPGIVTDIAWFPNKPYNRFLISCNTGEVVQIILDDKTRKIIKEAIEDKQRGTYVLNVPQIKTQAVIGGRDDDNKYFSRYMGHDLIWIEEKSTLQHHNYLYKIGGAPVAKLNISDGRTVQCMIELLGGRYMALGLDNGTIKIIKKGNKSCDFSDSWQVVMHGTRNSGITKLCLSYDHTILYSCGTDSAIFAYKVNVKSDREIRPRHVKRLTSLPKGITTFPVLDLSLEEERIRKKNEAKLDRHKQMVTHFKEMLITFLGSYYKLVEMNKSLPKCLRIPKTFFRLQTSEERELEKRRILANETKILAPLRARRRKLFERVHTIKKHFIDPIKTQKFYLFAVRKPNYLKSFPERRLFSKDPLGEVEDPEVKRQEERWQELFAGLDTTNTPKGPTEFERMMKKVVRKLAKEREMEINYDHGMGANKTEGHGQEQKEDVPDLITAAGTFLNEHGKFTQAEKTTFNRINANRLKRMKCAKEMERVQKLKTGFQNYYDKVDSLFKNLIKTDTKDKERVPLVSERLHHLLNLRQLIYLHKEKFNIELRALRKEKTALINYSYWAQVEYKYMIDDLKPYGLDLTGIELPKPLEVVWDLEYPDHLKFKPGPMPSDIKLRMKNYSKELKNIGKLIPLASLRNQAKKHGMQNHKLFELMKKRKERFWSSMITIRETLDKMITDFDSKFMPLILHRSSASLEINYLKAEYSSTLQEVDILYRYEILQTSASRYKFETLKMKHVFILRDNIRKKKLARFNEQMKECHRTIDDLNAKFMELVRDDKWAKHLNRTYKKKYKHPRKDGSAATTVSSDSSSSDDDDDYDDEMDDDLDDSDERSPMAGAGVAYIYDETIIPPGCDEEKFRHTFKLRNQRHVEENRIAEIKREKEVIVEEVRSIKKVIKICDGLLALFYSGTFRFQKMMKDEMNDIEYLITLHPSQIQIFDKKDPFKNVPPLEECKLIEQEEYIVKTKTLRQLKDAIDEVSAVVAKTQKCTKMQLKELHRLADKNSKRYKEISDLLASKFGWRIDVDVGQTHVLVSMIKRAIRRTAKELMEKEKREKSKEEKTVELRHKGELIKTKRERMRTLQTLYTIEAENNRIIADKLKRATNSSKGKMDLAKEKDLLLKKLEAVEEEEKKLAAAIKEV
ncbi:hypothetical protein GE061_008313 [Apolygus lucorum]|uniref:Uncharacterized protein n=1 Tax=Apolygus lucorum TaxID=248454 RepID=A0A6A4IWA8_APOLU|nr:hypothetical protein GE061_008313 [Apolygus lucorum]